MAKLTLLEMVQDILNDMDSDDVNSINDTEESAQVANVVRTTYRSLIDNKNWPHLKTLFQLPGLADASTPSHMRLPDDVKEVDKCVSLRYNKRKAADTRDKYERVYYRDIEWFLNETNGRNSANANVQTVTDPAGATLYVRNDKQPEWWTSFDDEYIVFDSFDNGVDSTLQESKTQLIAYREPTFTLSDSFVPDLPSESFSGLLAEAKSVCFDVLKQAISQKTEQNALRQRRWLSRKDWRARGGIRSPNYGRNSRYGNGRGRGKLPTIQTNPFLEKD